MTAPTPPPTPTPPLPPLTDAQVEKVAALLSLVAKQPPNSVQK